METVDDETLDAAVDFIDRQVEGRQAVLRLVERHAYAFPHAQAYVGKFLKTFEQFPPRQKPASFSVGGQMEELEKALSRLNGDID